jgi:hypothetical protein
LEILSAAAELNRRANGAGAPAANLVSGESPPAPLDRSIFEGEIQIMRLLNSSVCSRIPTLLFALACMLLVGGSAGSANAQVRKGGTAMPANPEDASPSFNEYRGIQLGMISDDVRKKLGDPRDKGEEQDFWVFNEEEMAQVVYDKTHKVITISADFTNATKAITAKQVFGTDVEAKADGSVYKMVRYTKAGYWLSYNRTGGSTPLTTITLQKIQ